MSNAEIVAFIANRILNTSESIEAIKASFEQMILKSVNV